MSSLYDRLHPRSRIVVAGRVALARRPSGTPRGQVLAAAPGITVIALALGGAALAFAALGFGAGPSSAFAAAAKIYFGITDLSKLMTAQAALLASLLK